MNTAKKLLSVGLVLAASGLMSCATPPPECTIGQSSTTGPGLTGLAAFSVRYKLKDGTGECANLKGDVIGFQSYHPADSTGKARDFSKTSIAIRPWSVGELQWMIEDAAGIATEQFCADGADDDGDGKIDDADEDCHYNAIGDFTATDPDASDLCHVQTATQHIVFPGADVPVDTGVACDTTKPDMGQGDCMGAGDCIANDPMDPTAGGECFATVTLASADLQYDWSNINVFVTAAVVGTQFTADLKITLNGSVCNYTAIGMWPAVDCGVHDPDTGAVTGTDIAFCNPEADAPNGRPVGSGINPDFGPVACDTGISLVPVVDDYYTNVAQGFPLSTPRCVITGDTIPQLSGFSASPTQ